jgi:hypothetical protein
MSKMREQKSRYTYLPAHLRLIASGDGNDVRLVQELMRHARLTTTMEV